jgi:uncharacterized membrane protein
MNSTADQLVDDYLKRLRKELAGLPRERRRELEQEISEHIAEARAALSAQNEAEIRTLLDRTGDPADIAAEARERFGIERRKTGAVEIGALILLPIGGILVPVIGWIVGVILLWASQAWTTRDKLIGTLILPGGLLLPFGLGFVAGSGEACVQTSGGVDTCSGGGTGALGLAALIVLFLLPLASTAYLIRRMRRGTAVLAT